MIALILVFVTVTLTIHYYFKLQDGLKYWKKRNIPNPKAYPIVGNMLENFLYRKNFGQLVKEAYDQFQGYPVVGFFKLSNPCLIVRDPDLVKCVLVKDFRTFRDNEVFMDKKIDPLLGRNPFVQRGNEWKTSRGQITPQFTNQKMKALFPLIDPVCTQLVNFVDKNKSQPIELKELCAKFTVSNVATCAFGIDAHCFENTKSEFRKIADAFITPESIQGIKIMIAAVFPKINSFLSIKATPKHIEDKFRSIVRDTMDYRKANNIVRNDFIQAMYDHLYKPNDSEAFDDIVGHATTFLFDGYETSAIVFSFTLFYLALNPDAQEKLRNEINNVLEENDGQFTYESLTQMAYLNACVDESLRMHPPIYQLGKVCNETFKYRPSNLTEFKDMEVTIDKDMIVYVAPGGMHYDEKYFPEPNEFRPERFLDKDIPKYAYLPFGEGPRICLGQKFGLLQVRMGVAQIIRHFQLRLNGKTKLPLRMDPWYLLQAPVGGLWIDFEKI